MLPAIKQEERRYDMEGFPVVFLQEAVDDLSSHIVGMVAKQDRGEELVRATRYIVVGMEILRCLQLFDQSRAWKEMLMDVVP